MGNAVEILPPLRFAGRIECPRFRIVGRVDDRLDPSNGRKVNPTLVLDAVQLYPHVEAVVMFGFDMLVVLPDLLLGCVLPSLSCM